MFDPKLGFWVISLPPAFQGRSNFFTKISQKKFSTGPQLSEYVQVVSRNTNGTCLKSVSKTKWPILDSCWRKWPKR